MEILEEKLKRETNQWKRAAEVYFVFITFVWDRFHIFIYIVLFNIVSC